jgi:hypothetical protein
MALQEKRSSPKQQDKTIGPVMANDGNPPNPSDAIRLSGVPLKFPPNPGHAQVIRRPFSEPTKSFLHRGEYGNPTRPSEGPSNEEVMEPRPTYDPYENSWGQDANKYSGGPNEPTTSRGQPIRGT